MDGRNIFVYAVNSYLQNLGNWPSNTLSDFDFSILINYDYILEKLVMAKTDEQYIKLTRLDLTCSLVVVVVLKTLSPLLNKILIPMPLGCPVS
jgi:hypothetical protein